VQQRLRRGVPGLRNYKQNADNTKTSVYIVVLVLGLGLKHYIKYLKRYSNICVCVLILKIVIYKYR